MKKIFHYERESEESIIQKYLGDKYTIYIKRTPGMSDVYIKCADVSNLREARLIENSGIEERISNPPFSGANFHYELSNLIIEKIGDSITKELIPKTKARSFPGFSTTEYHQKLISQKTIILIDKKGNKISASIKASNPTWDAAVFAVAGDKVDVTLTEKSRTDYYKIEKLQNKSMYLKN